MTWLTDNLDNLNKIVETMDVGVDITLRTKAINVLFKHNKVSIILDNGYRVVVDEVTFKEDGVVFKAGSDEWNSDGISNTTKLRIIDII